MPLETVWVASKQGEASTGLRWCCISALPATQGSGHLSTDLPHFSTVSPELPTSGLIFDSASFLLPKSNTCFLCNPALWLQPLSMPWSPLALTSVTASFPTALPLEFSPPIHAHRRSLFPPPTGPHLRITSTLFIKWTVEGAISSPALTSCTAQTREFHPVSPALNPILD